MSRGVGSRAAGMATPPSSLPTHRISLMASRKAERDESAIEDDQNDEVDDEENNGLNKSRTRRASEGQQLMKGDGKKAHASDLRCEKCGKGYKHSSCLTKHLFVPTLLSYILFHIYISFFDFQLVACLKSRMLSVI